MPFLRNLSGPHQNSIVLTGIRVSLYNAITETSVDTLVQFMEKFVSEAGSQASP
jgi:phosphoserine aminotransferase